MNKTNSQKIIVFISLTLVLCFFSVLIFSFINNERIKNIKLNDFNAMIYKTNQLNNTYKIFTNNNIQPNDEPIFSNSKEAIITATENLKTRENFYIYSPGTVTTDAGLKIIVQSQSQIWKWSSTEMFEDLITLQTKGIDMDQTLGTQTYTANSQSYKRTTKQVKNTGSGLTSSFEETKFSKTNLLSTQVLHYTFNKHTILNPSDLIIYKTSDGKISHYAVNFNLSTTIGINTYAQIIKDNSNGAAKSLPEFKTISMRMEIDAVGDIKSLYVFEVCTMNVGINATLTNEFNYIFKPLSEAPSINKPNI